jgi:hypothetical protein
MKQGALALIRNVQNPNAKLNLLREYLQAFTLRSLHESRAFQCLSFVGGTSLRFLYGIPRFSEDLDFSLEHAPGYTPQNWLAKLNRDLTVAGFNVRVTWNEKKVVHTGWLRAADILVEAGITDLPEQKLSIKLEIDTKPPAGAVTENSVVNRHMIFVVRHHDLPSMLAGKIHALCTRKYLKGRDWYDILWYGTLRPPIRPNTNLLENALAQTGFEIIAESEQWKEYLITRLDTINQGKLIKDIAPFLEEPREINIITKDNIKKTINSFT